MTKYLLLLTLLISSSIMAEESNSFEAELKMLEAQDLKDEAAFKRAETITQKELNEEVDILTDTVSTGNAGVKKEEFPAEKSEIVIAPAKVKNRRVRSR